MKRASFLGIALALVMAAILPIPAAAESIFCDPQGRYSFVLPDGFQPLSPSPYAVGIPFENVDPPIEIITAADSVHTNVDVVSPNDLERELDDTAALMSKRGFGDPASIRQISLDGWPGRQVVYLMPYAPNNGIRENSLLTIKDDTLYIILIRGYQSETDAIRDVAYGILSSFTFSAARCQPGVAV